MSRPCLAALVLSLALPACGQEDPAPCPPAVEHMGTPTGATCDGSSLTYDNFGQTFMTNYCTSCHSSSLKGGEARSCAPDDHNFDTLDEVMLNRDHIDEHAAAGPESVNHHMPPAGSKQPTEQERRDLGTWLACETERMP